MASAVVACQRWGLSTRYVGKVGDNSPGKLQIDEMEREGVDAQWIIARGCASQTSHILVDEASGERTVLWNRDSSIALRAEDLKREWISDASALLVDGHDTAAAGKRRDGPAKRRYQWLEISITAIRELKRYLNAWISRLHRRISLRD